MNAFLKKEIRLNSLPLTWLFIGFAALTMCPGYPILCGTFFITLGIYQSFQSAREANDILYSALLPVAKQDVVKGKFAFVTLIELCGFAVMMILTLVRMTVLADVPVYVNNALMNANFFFLGMTLLIFGIFNGIFVGGYYRTAYQLGKPFMSYIFVSFFMIFISKALHHMPGLRLLNAFGFNHIGIQSALLFAGVAAYALITALSCKKACRDFEKIDL
jgi:hypothetical protein